MQELSSLKIFQNISAFLQIYITKVHTGNECVAFFSTSHTIPSLIKYYPMSFVYNDKCIPMEPQAETTAVEQVQQTEATIPVPPCCWRTPLVATVKEETAPAICHFQLFNYSSITG